ncbi:PorT family protein [Marinilongibacter aquaticus]|uniref:porin family protein n=1 Tax=Marinilongibacter aquaticus TaxID=2975157 RepID=UPI0021BD6349|nr:porin family protein [Marinilongibacter aquaticus]UBM58375.1 PorT family protein [Marinilongibacter aquaticus]
MKKISIVLLFSLISLGTFAQSGFGVKGGINLTQIHTDAGSLKDNFRQSLDTQTGYVLGLWGRLGDKFYLQPEVLVSKKGGKVYVFDPSTSTVTNELVDVKYTNLDIPVLIGIRPMSFLRIMAGPVASVKLSEDYTYRDAIASYTNNTNDAIKNSTWGYQAGIGFKIGSLDLDIRHEGSLSDINANHFQDSKFSQRAKGWVVSLGLKIL